MEILSEFLSSYHSFGTLIGAPAIGLVLWKIIQFFRVFVRSVDQQDIRDASLREYIDGLYQNLNSRFDSVDARLDLQNKSIVEAHRRIDSMMAHSHAGD